MKPNRAHQITNSADRMGPWLPARGETRSHGIREARRWYRVELCLSDDSLTEWYLINRWPLARSFGVWTGDSLDGG